MKKLIPKPSPLQALEGFEELMNAYKENHKVTEEEITKRKHIDAMKAYEIEKIHAQKEVLKDYLKYVFSERRINFDKMFNALDQGIKNNDTQAIQASMSMIITLSQESPLKNIQSIVSDFNNPDVESITI